MNPGDLSRMAVFDGSSLSAGARLVLLSLAAASGPDNVAHVSAGRLATRCGLSEGHVRRLLRALVEAQMVTLEQVPGRASKVTIEVPEAQERVRAGAQGGARRRAGGCAPARTVSSNSPSYIPTRAAAAGPDGPPQLACEGVYVKPDSEGVLTNGDRRAWVAQIRTALAGGVA